ncbi:MAG: tryptophan dimethylallyltransferase family protein, partial [Actinocatenispora sp.]
TPVEFSIALDHGRAPTLRLLGETVSSQPGATTNLRAAHELLYSLADRYDVNLDRFHHVKDLFTPENPQGKFSMWYSLVFPPGRRPSFKIYFNTDVRGTANAAPLVAEALTRLGLHGAYETLLAHAVRRGQLGAADRFSFFALDLHKGPKSRVKVYMSHDDAESHDMVRAAAAVPGIDTTQADRFCSLVGGGSGPFDTLPLVSSYNFVQGDSFRPSTYSLYVPIRGYVSDDAVARHRVAEMVREYGFDRSVIDRGIAACTTRRLDEGVGLIAHASLRLGAGRPGVTVYLSSEAYRVTPALVSSATHGHPCT